METEVATPVRIQRSRKKGSRLTSPNGLAIICVGREGMWGNPFKIGSLESIRTKADSVEAYRLWLDVNPIGRTVALMARERLRGVNLACWCKPGDPCHADVLLKLANAEEPLPMPATKNG